jgi:hypothetical protein
MSRALILATVLAVLAVALAGAVVELARGRRPMLLART